MEQLLIIEDDIGSVSYTHLDVYKRQVRGCFEMDVQRSAFRHDVLIAVAVLFTLIVFLLSLIHI